MTREYYREQREFHMRLIVLWTAWVKSHNWRYYKGYWDTIKEDAKRKDETGRNSTR